MILHSDGTGTEKNANFPVHVFDWKNVVILKKILDKHNISIAFVDSYLAEANIYEIISKKVKKLISIDDTNRISYPFGSTILNPGFGGNYIEYNTYRNQIFSGAEYVLLRKPFREKFVIPDLRENIESILITVGGEDRLNIVPKILNLLKDKYPNKKKQIVIGPAFKNLDEILNYKDKNTYFHKNLNAYTMRELLLSVDLAITAGGQTTYELVQCNIPMVIVEVVKNQEKNIRRFSELGIYNLLGYEDNVEFLNQLSEILCKLESKDQRIFQREKFTHLQNNHLLQRLNAILLS